MGRLQEEKHVRREWWSSTSCCRSGVKLVKMRAGTVQGGDIVRGSQQAPACWHCVSLFGCSVGAHQILDADDSAENWQNNGNTSLIHYYAKDQNYDISIRSQSTQFIGIRLYILFSNVIRRPQLTCTRRVLEQHWLQFVSHTQTALCHCLH